MARYKITLAEPHRVKSVWRRGSESAILGTVRSHTPLHTQPIVAARLREALGSDYQIDILDARLLDPDNEELYRSVSYGGGILQHYRVGLSLESPVFADAARDSDILGITVNFTQEAGVAVDTGVRAKELNPRLKLVYAGADARARHEHYLTIGRGDAVVMGEGERCSPRLIRALLGMETLGQVPSIAYSDAGSTRMGPEPRWDVVPMEEVPLPAFDLVGPLLESWNESHEGPLPEGVEPPLAYVELSRGCHETCEFCYTAGIKYRTMLTPQVDAYARHLKEHGIRSLMMISDNELTPMLMKKVKGTDLSGRELLVERYRVLRDHGLTWEFSNGLQYSMLRCNGRMDDELIEALFDGCYRLFTPIEDPLDLGYEKLFGTPADRRKSSMSLDEIFYKHHVEVLARIAAAGLKMFTFGLIIGWPGDTPERARRVTERCLIIKRAIKEANPSSQTFFTPFIGIPIPGTANWFEYRKKGLLKEDVATHPEAWQFALTAYGNHEMIDERLRMIAALDGEVALDEWTSTGAYPIHVE
jgi:radical SAM superfamily enzyme YgiQ (UPF0313 family)